MAEHSLKTVSPYFEAVESGAKTFEIRTTGDRYFSAGDVLLLQHWRNVGADPSAGYYVGDDGSRTSRAKDARTLRMRVTYVLHGGRFGVPEGYCVMSIAPVDGATSAREASDG